MRLEGVHLHVKPQILNDVSFGVLGGEVVGILGPNGAGKSTLLSVLAGLLRPDRGDVQLDGQPLSHISLAERSRSIGYLEQNAECSWPLRVEQIVALGRLPYSDGLRAQTEKDRSAIHRAMAACDLTNIAKRPLSCLSGGEKNRALLARAFAGEHRVLLADEPLASLDLWHQLQIIKALRAQAQQGAAVVLTLHDLSLAAHYCDRLYLLNQGRVVACGTPAETLTPEVIYTVYKVKLTSISYNDIPFVIPGIA